VEVIDGQVVVVDGVHVTVAAKAQPPSLGDPEPKIAAPTTSDRKADFFAAISNSFTLRSPRSVVY
jgi:hypothetical protein